MLKKLQKRFILINMVLVGAVLLIGFCAVVFTSYVHQKANVERALNRAINMMQSDQSLFGRPQLGDNSNDEITPTMTMIVDADGNLVGLPQGSFTMQDSTLEEVRNQVFHVNASEGKLHNWNLYYKKHLQADGSTIIAFTSATALNKNIMSTVTYSILLFVSSMVVIFIISYVLSRLAIKPVRRAWNQQQQFVADASHELKTPLTVILANNDILLAHKNDSVSNQSKWVESTKAEATHMKNLVNNLLYLARSDANKGKPVFSEVPFGEITINSALQLEPVAFDNGVMLDYENVDTEVKMIGDATALNQLVQILIDNACKYGDPSSQRTRSRAPAGAQRR
jgi:two-component system sensor histidine kinase CiaH